MPTKDRTRNDRKTAWRLSKKAAGLKEIRNLWIKPEHEARVREAARQIEEGWTQIYLQGQKP